MDISKYTITNIRRGKNERRHVIYAELRDEKNELVISATLQYIHDRISEMTKEPVKSLKNIAEARILDETTTH